MNKHSVARIAFAISSLLIWQSALAEKSIQRSQTFGMGVEVGKSESGERNGGFVLRSTARPQIDGEAVGILLGSRSTDLRVGRGIGLSGSRNTGVNLLMKMADREAQGLVGASNTRPLLPVVGVHPAAASWELNTSDDSRRLDYIEWSPHFSVHTFRQA
jgi:hypothetical protein